MHGVVVSGGDAANGAAAAAPPGGHQSHLHSDRRWPAPRRPRPIPDGVDGAMEKGCLERATSVRGQQQRR